ncbi:hypothetical protein HPB49_014974 [Dermacentor silvarum]|uniref:Uncharacterized protein n=1 Tax=Dermacentor silvarum TaxID=543639 RepID=A0ACB8DE61_DERSI|nr:hypothetical protein HPB49_014974 [Dermacentor silvarum]
MAASQESMADLSGSLIERFLDAVQQHPCVYDTKRLDYRDSGRKLNAWERIRLDSGLSTVEECHKLWKRLRDRYTRELKAIESAQRSGSGYVSRRAWEFAESMAFYKECGRPRKTTCSLEFPRSGGDLEETAESIFSGMQSTSSSPSANESSDTLIEDLPSPATPTPVATPTLVTERRQAPQQRKNKKKTDSFEDQLLGKLDRQMTENEAFGLSIGMSLDRMPRKVASKGKSRIMQIIAELEEEID